MYLLYPSDFLEVLDRRQHVYEYPSLDAEMFSVSCGIGLRIQQEHDTTFVGWNHELQTFLRVEQTHGSHQLDSLSSEELLNHHLEVQTDNCA